MKIPREFWNNIRISKTIKITRTVIRKLRHSIEISMKQLCSGIIENDVQNNIETTLNALQNSNAGTCRVKALGFQA